MATHNFSIFPELETERLLLRQLTIADGDKLAFLRSDESVNKYINRPKSSTREEALQFIQKINNGISANECLYWVLTEKGPAELVGTICLWNFKDQATIAEVGFELLPDFQRKGIMQEALLKIIQFGFTELKLTSIEAITIPDNLPSIRLLEKFKFKNTAVEKNKTAAAEMIWVLKNSAG